VRLPAFAAEDLLREVRFAAEAGFFTALLRVFDADFARAAVADFFFAGAFFALA
jgi:hypothetical protein